MKLGVLGLTMFALLSCSTTPAATKIEPSKPVIVFVPGYKGSALRDSTTGERIWVTLSQELFGDRSLELSLPELGISQLPLQHDGVLEHVRIVPGLYSVNVYGSWLRHLEKLAGSKANVIGFAYDWRQNNVTTAGELAQLINELRQAGVPKVLIVAHSMGGLVTSYFMRYDSKGKETWQGAENIDGVVFIGTGFQGAAAVFRDMQKGSFNKFNRTFLNQRAISTFPSAYQLLPPPGQSMLINEQRQSIHEQVFDAEVWQKNGWGLFKEAGLTAEQIEARLAYLKVQLHEAVEFKRRIHSPSNRTPDKLIPVLNIFARGVTTLNSVLAYRKGNQPRLAYNQQTLDESQTNGQLEWLVATGDNTITVNSAQLPDVFKQLLPTETVAIEAEHSEMGNNPAAHDAIGSFLLKQLTVTAQ